MKEQLIHFFAEKKSMNSTESIQNSDFLTLSSFYIYILFIVYCDHFYDENNHVSSAGPLLGTSSPFWSSESSEHFTKIKYWNFSE